MPTAGGLYPAHLSCGFILAYLSETRYMNRDGAMQSVWQQEIKKFEEPSSIAGLYNVAIVGCFKSVISIETQ